MTRFFQGIRAVFVRAQAALREGRLRLSRGRRGLVRVEPSEPVAMQGTPETRSTTPSSIASAHYSEVEQRPEGEAVTRDHRQELSSMIGPHAIAPSEDAAGVALVDTGAVEVPVGHSSDASYDDELDHAKLVQPDTTGASLQEPFERTFGMFEDLETENLTAQNHGRASITAQPKRAEDHELFPFEDEHYDAVEPEDLGALFLSRATEDNSGGHREDYGDELLENETDRDALRGDVVPHLVSEASRASALLEEDELSEIEVLENDDDLGEEVRQTLPMDVRNRERKIETRVRRT